MFKKVFIFMAIAPLLMVSTNLVSKENDDDDDSRKKGREFREIKQDIKQQNRSWGDRDGSRPPQQQQRNVKQQSHPQQQQQPDARQQYRPQQQQQPDARQQYRPQQQQQRNVKQQYRPQQQQQPDTRQQYRPQQQQQRNVRQQYRTDERFKEDILEDRQPTKSWTDRVENYFDEDRDHENSSRRFSRERLKQRESGWKDRARSYRHGFGDHKRRYHIFDNDYWNRFNTRHDGWFFDNRFTWYTYSSWPRIVVWLPWSWNTPVYYYYADDGNIYYRVNEEDPYFIPIDQNRTYNIDAISLANSNPHFSRNQNDWISLGTFALFRDEANSQMPQEYITLAISKDGAVTGAYVNVDENKPMQIEGAVDKASQRIAWKLVGQNWPVMETGLYNLTQKESTLIKHLSSSQAETKVIVQIEQ